MIRALIKKVSCLLKRNHSSATTVGQPIVIPRSEHGVSRKAISEHALKVLYRLNRHGYEAYLVGGSVRDLLLGLHPKDFDVVTNAKPEEVRRVFRKFLRNLYISLPQSGIYASGRRRTLRPHRS